MPRPVGLARYMNAAPLLIAVAVQSLKVCYFCIALSTLSIPHPEFWGRFADRFPFSVFTVHSSTT